MPGFAMRFVDEKYLINVDLPTESIIHMNPLLYQTDTRCTTGVKIPNDGGIILATEEDVRRYLYGTEVLTLGSVRVDNLRWCKICRQHSDSSYGE